MIRDRIVIRLLIIIRQPSKFIVTRDQISNSNFNINSTSNSSLSSNSNSTSSNDSGSKLRSWCYTWLGPLLLVGHYHMLQYACDTVHDGCATYIFIQPSVVCIKPHRQEQQQTKKEKEEKNKIKCRL